MDNFKRKQIMRYEGLKMNKHTRVTVFGIMILCLSLGQSAVFGQDKESLSRGAVILADKTEPVSFFDENIQPLGKSSTIPGVLLPVGAGVETGAGGGALLLLSNGTVITISANTKMKISSFVQEPFDDKGQSVGDLKEEPSSSSVLVDLEVGDLVVKTKKLNKKSNFEISSPVGTAGIRGTQFGMGFSPQRGMSLDVTESTVSFKPRGGGRTRRIPAGRGLTAPTRGQPVERPVTPVVRGRINQTNDKATRSTNDFSLGYVTKAMDKATQEKPPSREEDRRRKEDTGAESQEEANPGNEEQPPEANGEPKGDEPSQGEGPSQGEPNQGDGPKADNQAGDANQGQAPKADNQAGDARQPNQGQGNNVAKGPSREERPSKTWGGNDRPQAGNTPQSKPLPPVAANLPMATERPRASEILENTPDIKQARKTGKVSKATKQLARLALDEKETIRFHDFPQLAQDKLIKESPEVTKRVLEMEGFGSKQAETFLGYSAETRSKIVGLSDEAAISLLNQGLDENLLAATLTEQNVKASDPSKVPATVKPASSDQSALALGEKLMNSGNAHVMDELKIQSTGELSGDQLRQAEVANLLLTDYQLSPTGGPNSLSSSEVLANPFYEEIASLYQELETEQLVAGQAKFVSGRNLIVPANAQALAPYSAGSSGQQPIVLSASEKITFEGNLDWGDKPENAARLVVMSAGEASFAQGMSLGSATSDLVLSSRRDITMDGVKLEVSQEAIIRGMRDVSLNNVQVGADAVATIKANRNLNVDGLTFSRGVSSILMEATTVRLSNVNFPINSAVRLNSLKGPLDGKYPNFGSAIPAAEQIGRVNFIKNVSSGGNVLNTRQAFDQYGQNITIGKIAKP